MDPIPVEEPAETSTSHIGEKFLSSRFQSSTISCVVSLVSSFLYALILAAASSLSILVE